MPSFDPIYIIAILIALTVHEWAHAYTATRLGDPTSYNEGRLTLNPIAHIDPIGAILFLMAGFGWAKPVPVNPSYFRNPRTGMLLTAAAGPFSNFLIAAVCFALLSLLTAWSGEGSVWSLLSVQGGGESVGQMFFLRLLSYSLFVNLGLMAFNLIPIAPLDGSKVLQAFIPLRLEDRYMDFMRIGPMLLLGILLAEAFTGLSVLSPIITTIMEWVLVGFGVVFGML